MVGRTNVGGGGAGTGGAYAYIQTTYPAGSTCTATNGLVTLTAPDTTGLYVFGVPEPSSVPQSWTVACTDGTLDASESFSIDGRYQVNLIELRYGLPAAYTQLERLRTTYSTTNNSYLDTGMTRLEEDDQVQIVFDPYQGIHGTDGIVMMAGSSYQFYLGDGILEWGSTRVTSNRFYSSTDSPILLVINDSQHRVTYKRYNSTDQPTVLGTVFGVSTPSNTDHIYLFGPSSRNQSNADVSILSYKRIDNTTGNLVQDFTPCQRISDQAYGFYDLVNRVFYPIVGTNVYTA